MEELSVIFVDSIEEIGMEEWNALTGIDNPFVRYEFLHALESTGCTTDKTGWKPMHVWVTKKDAETESGKIQSVAVMPLYLKNNSWGEYVFDWAWADAYSRHGLKYYPKFVTSIPFTPSGGRRVFIKNGMLNSKLTKVIFGKVKAKAEALGASSWHILFPSLEEHQCLSSLNALARIATQFHWYNKGYKSFENFLEALNARKRKAIKKERKHVKDQGIKFHRTEGREISEEQWVDFYLFYQTTYLARGMQGYLEMEFFIKAAENMPDQILLINAVSADKDIAAALFFKSKETLFGRYWGSRYDKQFLHFETCYYQGQEYAIENNLHSFDSGAQGEHKIQRGFEPIFTYSNHWIANQKFSAAIEDFLGEERIHIIRYREEAESLLPFKKT
jgi:hypothetical protein